MFYVLAPKIYVQLFMYHIIHVHTCINRAIRAARTQLLLHVRSMIRYTVNSFRINRRLCAQFHGFACELGCLEASVPEKEAVAVERHRGSPGGAMCVQCCCCSVQRARPIRGRQQTKHQQAVL